MANEQRHPFKVQLVLDACEQQGISKAELARKLGVHNSTVSHWLSNSSPEPPLIARIANALGLSFEELYVVPESERGLVYHRVRKGLYAKDVAAEIGSSAAVVRFIEAGHRRLDRTTVDLAAWARLLDLTPEQFAVAAAITNRVIAEERKAETTAWQVVTDEGDIIHDDLSHHVPA